MTHLEKLAEEYEVENYFDYIIESQINGNFSQVRELARELTSKERKSFFDYCKECGRYGDETIKNIVSDTTDAQRLSEANRIGYMKGYADGYKSKKF